MSDGVQARARSVAGGLPLPGETQREALVPAGLWLVRLRWIAVAAITIVVFGATELGARVPQRSASMLWWLVGFLALFNTLLTLGGRRRLAGGPLLALQLGVDTAALAVAVHLAGGLANPFAGLFAFQAVIVSLLLQPASARLAAICIALLVVCLTALEASGALPPGCLRDGLGRCMSTDPLHLTAWGLSSAALSLGCSWIVRGLMRQLCQDRDELARTTKGLATEAERLEQARGDLLLEQHKLQSIVDCMADAVIFAVPDGSVVLHNRAAAKVFEAQRDQPHLKVCHPKERWQELLAALENPGPLEQHPVLEVGDRSLEATFARVQSADGGMFGAVMVARDVTDRLDEQRHRVDQERMATTGRLAAALAHELNNPLGVISLFTQHALKGVDAQDPLRDHLQTVRRNADLCKKIVRQLLGYARQRAPERQVLDPYQLLENVGATVAAHAKRGQIDVAIEIPPALGRRIHGDSTQLHQVLVNLGLNAIDAMPGGGTLRFAVRPGRGHGVVIDVADSGTGIAEHELDRIFNAFYTTKTEGTGLGLAVARDLVAAHNGRITVETNVGDGTTFSLHLPGVAREEAA